MKLLLLITKQELINTSAKISELLIYLMVIPLSCLIFIMSEHKIALQSTVYGLAFIWAVIFIFSFSACEYRLKEDFENHTLHNLYLAGFSFETQIFAKILNNYITLTPIIIASAFIAFILFNLEYRLFVPFAFGILITMPSLSALIFMGASLCLGSNRAAVIMPVVILPLTLPLLTSTASLVNLIVENQPCTDNILFISGYFILMLSATTKASAFLIKEAVK